MNRLGVLFFAFLLAISATLSLTPLDAQAAYSKEEILKEVSPDEGILKEVNPEEVTPYHTPTYCSNSNGESTSRLGDFRLRNGTILNGMCHIDYWHMHQLMPGFQFANVDGEQKSQFSRRVTRQELVDIAFGLEATGTTTKQGTQYKVEGFDISLNQYIRVVYYYNRSAEGVMYKEIITAYPYK